jgi:hypothetical protein
MLNSTSGAVYPQNVVLRLRRLTLLPALLAATLSIALAQAPRPVDAKALVEKIQSELSGPFPPDEGKPDGNVPHGEFLQGTIADSKIYPGTENGFEVYVPAQYDPAKPACLLVKLDGLGAYEGTVLDNLIARGEIPVMIGIGIVPGTIWKDPAGTPKRAAFRFNRSYEFDSLNDHFPEFVIDELLPAVQKLKTHLERQRPCRYRRQHGRYRLLQACLAPARPVHTRLLRHRHLCRDARRQRISRPDSQDRSQADPHFPGRRLDRFMEPALRFLVRR